MDTTLEQKICLACGFCCDGTLFVRVRIQAEESVESYKKAGLNIQSEKDGETVMLQPCAAFRKDQCQSYQCRPLRCGTFRCGLLKRLDLGEIDLEAVMNQIETVKDLRHRFNKKLHDLLPHLESVALAENMRRFRKDARRLTGPSLKTYRTERKVLLDLKEQLQSLLDAHFYVPEDPAQAGE